METTEENDEEETTTKGGDELRRLRRLRAVITTKAIADGVGRSAGLVHTLKLLMTGLRTKFYHLELV
uniref:Uncharacterized protein n=1 Tax=Romanomermis culicivorax TaxID=13658 RepID=A0A915HZV2_ROMCU